MLVYTGYGHSQENISLLEIIFDWAYRDFHKNDLVCYDAVMPAFAVAVSYVLLHVAFGVHTSCWILTQRDTDFFMSLYKEFLYLLTYLLHGAESFLRS